MAIQPRKHSCKQRPDSLNLTLKVVRAIHQLRRQLKPRVSTLKTTIPILGSKVCLGLETEALRSIEKGLARASPRSSKQLHHSSNRICKRRKNSRPSVPLQATDQHCSADQSPSSEHLQQYVQGPVSSYGNISPALTIATCSDDRLFLLKQREVSFDGCSLNQTILLLVLVYNAIEVLREVRATHDDQFLIEQGHEFGLNIDERFIANYLHILLSLQGKLLETLARKAVESLLENDLDKRQRQLLNWLVSLTEHPDDKHLLSTTWPWSLKPSLAVLWGVCWMFYYEQTTQQRGRKENGTSNNSQRVPQQLFLHNNEQLQAWNAPNPNECIETDANFGRELIEGIEGIAGTQAQQVTTDASAADNPGFAAPPNFAASYNHIYSPHQAPHLNNIHTNLSNYGQPSPQQPQQQQPYSNNNNNMGHERNDSVNTVSIPTPISMAESRSPLISPLGHRRISSASSFTHTRQISEDRSTTDGDEDGTSPRQRNHSYKRAEEPPRNAENKMICKHPECTGSTITFDRKCEWSKHMDKHDRPYKCLVKGCEKLQGFTYSGGLLRHEREVHKMHGGTKKSLFCPFADCKRSSGAGFTRKENLAEHVRRVHRRTSMSSDLGHLIVHRSETIEEVAESRASAEMAYSHGHDARDDSPFTHKRKRLISDAGISEEGEDADLRAEVKRLRGALEEKDTRLQHLESVVMSLQRQSQSQSQSQR
ncbi:hypothetical protein B0J11DRAFT_445639 [Dendryphion nanum]|uniref:C2H2-type domain-containing protein n=1 Tax=Dendryphion nanum TaxID=256645 RepID=A0A9P9IBX5_9PLEO|nr:hypothetical protein B0J11DRAFT_445639 [Dendryphion nanum]